MTWPDSYIRLLNSENESPKSELPSPLGIRSHQLRIDIEPIASVECSQAFGESFFEKQLGSAPSEAGRRSTGTLFVTVSLPVDRDLSLDNGQIQRPARDHGHTASHSISLPTTPQFSMFLSNSFLNYARFPPTILHKLLHIFSALT